MPFIDLANVACGFHASDPSIMRETVRLAKKHAVKVGAHPSLPDLQGFGRRAMVISPAEVTDLVTYQVGALKAFLDAESVPLNHVKPHGALYGMAARDEKIAGAIADAVRAFAVPILGMAFTAHETVYRDRGIELIPEFYADLEYDGDGNLILNARCSRSGESSGKGGARDAGSRRHDDSWPGHSGQSNHSLYPFRYSIGGSHCRRVEPDSSAIDHSASDHSQEHSNLLSPTFRISQTGALSGLFRTHLPRRLAGPPLEGVGKGADFLIAEQPGDL